MTSIDLDGELIPGRFAAGLSIGDQFSDCEELLRNAVEVEYLPGFNLVEAINCNTGVLVVRNYFPLGSGNTAVFYRAHVITMQFNRREELYSVSMGEGYRGRAFGRVGVGSQLQEVRELFPVFYDDGDEMYYPDPESAVCVPSGIAFHASGEQPEDIAPILGISIHDWELMRRRK
jgi:hypothetical protein